MTKPSRRKLLIGLATVGLICLGVVLFFVLRYPPDTKPAGAYMRIASAIGRGEPAACFAYLEEEAQVASYTIHSYAKKAAELISKTYPEPQRSQALASYQPLADAVSPPQVWVAIARRRGWIKRLRRDLSGARSIEIAGERATVVTARGTRYPFRRRPNKIWGLTIFTAALDTKARNLARDWSLIQQAAADYQKAVPTKPTK